MVVNMILIIQYLNFICGWLSCRVCFQYKGFKWYENVEWWNGNSEIKSLWSYLNIVLRAMLAGLMCGYMLEHALAV